MSFNLSLIWGFRASHFTRVVVAGLFLVAAAPPAPVEQQPVELSAKVAARGCVPQRALLVVAAARGGLVFVTEPHSELSASFRRAVPPLPADVVHNQPLHSRRPRFRGRSGRYVVSRK